jgi:hypothetical protein
MKKTIAAGLLLPALFLAASLQAQEKPGLDCRFDEKGLVSAAYGGETIVRDGRINVLGVTLQERAVDPATGLWTYPATHLKAPAAVPVFDAATKTVAFRYDWGEITSRYTPERDRLTVDVAIRNATQQTLCGFWFDLMRLALPAKRGTDQGIGQVQRGVDRRIMQASSFGDNQLVVLVCESPETPLALGIDKPGEGEAGFPLLMTGGIPLPEPGEQVVRPGGRPAIPPGQTLAVRFSLRFATNGTPIAELCPDVDGSMRRLHGTGPAWADRRPIGMLIASAVGHATNNPRGWFNDKTIDVTTEEGRARFRARALAYADTAVKVLTNMNAQGGIVWDIEGSENPHPVTYIGDPRLVGTLAPEMDAVADDLFRKFREAGLRTGICIRPSRVYFDEAKRKWTHNVGNAWPKPTEYDELKPKEVPRHLFYPVARRLSDKIAYARKRWGCTIFYIDTNYIGQWVGEPPEQKLVEFPLTAQIYRDVMKEHPDVLLIPEHWKGVFGPQEATWAYAAPYMELDLGGTGTPEAMRRLFPGAFSIVNVADGPFEAKRDKLLESVKKGDILLFRGWFNDKKVNDQVKSVYDEAAGKANPEAGDAIQAIMAL